MKSRKKILMFGLVTILLIATLMPIATAGDSKKRIKDLKMSEAAWIIEPKKLDFDAPSKVKEGEKFKVEVFEVGDSAEKAKSKQPVEKALVLLKHAGKILFSSRTGKSGIVTIPAPDVNPNMKSITCTIVVLKRGYQSARGKIVIVNSEITSSLKSEMK